MIQPNGIRRKTDENLQILPKENFITLRQLKQLFPEWYWTSRPQGATKVPNIYQNDLLSFLNFEYKSKKTKANYFRRKI